MTQKREPAVAPLSFREAAREVRELWWRPGTSGLVPTEAEIEAVIARTVARGSSDAGSGEQGQVERAAPDGGTFTLRRDGTLIISGPFRDQRPMPVKGFSIGPLGMAVIREMLLCAAPPEPEVVTVERVTPPEEVRMQVREREALEEIARLVPYVPGRGFAIDHIRAVPLDQYPEAVQSICRRALAATPQKEQHETDA